MDVYLIKHSLPVLVAGEPSRAWRLGEEGRARAALLAERLGGAGIGRVVASPEPKALETAEILAGGVGLAAGVEIIDGLEEHHRETVPLFERAGELQAAVREMFARSGEVVLGEETADQAHARFKAALGRAVVGGSGGSGARATDHHLAAVCHGTVIALAVARANQIDPFELWRQLGLPSWVRVTAGKLRLLEVSP